MIDNAQLAAHIDTAFWRWAEPRTNWRQYAIDTGLNPDWFSSTTIQTRDHARIDHGEIVDAMCAHAERFGNPFAAGMMARHLEEWLRRPTSSQVSPITIGLTAA